MKLRGLVPNSYIHVSESDLYIPTAYLEGAKQTNPGNIYIAHMQIHECENWETQ